MTLAVYVAGVVVALVTMRDAWPSRVATALLWPLGPLAFVVVLAILLIAAAILWPALAIAAAGIIAALVYLVD